MTRPFAALSLAAFAIVPAGAASLAALFAEFVPFVVFYMRQPLKLDYLWASLCVLGAVYFIFRS